MYYHAIPAPMNLKHAPAPFLVATFGLGEDELPTIRPARDLGHAAELAHLEAGGACRPTVRIYRIEPGECRLVLSVRLDAP
jgi:hypothetical protein